MDLHDYAGGGGSLHLKEGLLQHISEIMAFTYFLFTSSIFHIILAIAKYPFYYILWCHILRHFYPLRLLLILFGWLHQVVDHLYLGLSPTKFKSSRASATHPHQIDSILASLMSSPDPLLLLLHTHLQHDNLKVFPKLCPDLKFWHLKSLYI